MLFYYRKKADFVISLFLYCESFGEIRIVEMLKFLSYNNSKIFKYYY